ncbi:MAG: Crp/Fnr family transcriptional regulator [Bacteroidetes bacterium]|nr:Crp/Fnr family transcriptional regulator [Bacteroidota bacterium]
MDLINQLKEEIDKAGLWVKTTTLKRNEFLKVRGSTDTNIYFVLSGSLRIYLEDEFEEHTIRFAYPGSIFASLDSFITGKPSPFYIQALKKCEVQVLPRQEFVAFIETRPELHQMWRQILEQLVVQQMEREVDLLTHSPAERYKRVLERSPHLFQEIPARYIASYLRMSPETLSRIRSTVEKP